MQIGKINQTDAVNSYQKVNRLAGEKVSVLQKPDSVQFSPEAIAITAAIKAAKSLDEVDVAKIAQMRQQIDAGTYFVDSNQLAKRMLDAITGS